jgi:manganese transport protein
MFIVKPLIGEVISGFAPSLLSGNALYIAIGIIGATVMPHNLYLHSSLVQTRKIERTAKGIKDSLKVQPDRYNNCLKSCILRKCCNI